MPNDTQPLTLEQFLVQSEKRIFRMAQLATGNRDEALDIVQDAMMKLVQKYSTRPASEWGPLLYRIVQSRITDWYRRQRVRNTLFAFWRSDDNSNHAVADNTIIHSSPATETVSQRNNATAALEQALRLLPLRQQQAFLLRAWEGMNTRETAAAMSCSEGSVKTHYSRALKHLKKQLGDYWP